MNNKTGAATQVTGSGDVSSKQTESSGASLNEIESAFGPEIKLITLRDCVVVRSGLALGALPFHCQLALKERLKSPDLNQFLANPSKETLGPKPFRFESLGEVIYYFRSQRLNPKKFKFFYAGDIELGASPSPGFEGDSSLF